MTTTHTPGPWGDCKCEPRVSMTGQGSIVYCPLHAAAGAMRDALKSLLKFNEELCQDIHVSTHYPSAETARALLRAVEG